MLSGLNFYITGILKGSDVFRTMEEVVFESHK